ncbi:hypothetical protein [Microbulbifer donghaiensis]|uniref:hypothetical protein n=1 Tax=Microbulbifer donghaiensis TaxID=494016 RepID=UPI0011611A2B|nr:hypothetical protein [Microbulbifer donghaiensis]
MPRLRKSFCSASGLNVYSGRLNNECCFIRTQTARNVDKRPHKEFVQARNGFFKSLENVVHF